MGEVKPVAWEGGGLRAEVDGGSVSVEERGNGPAQVVYYDLTTDDAETRAVALLLAAAEAGDGRAAVLNRVARALDCGPVTQDADRLREQLAAVRNALGCGEGSPVEAVLALREDLAAADAARAEAVQEATRLRVQCDAAAEACGVATVSAVPAAWGLLSAARAEAVQEATRLRVDMGDAREAVADTVAPLRGVVAGGSLMSPAALVATAVDMLRELPKLTRKPMTHRSLASIEANGLVVGDRLDWPADRRDAFKMERAVQDAGLDVSGHDGWPRHWPLTVVEAAR